MGGVRVAGGVLVEGAAAAGGEGTEGRGGGGGGVDGGFA